MARKLGEILIERGDLSASQLQEALRTQRIFAGSLGTHLLQLGFVDEAELGGALSVVYDVPSVSRDEIATAPRAVWNRLPAEFAHRSRSIAFRADRGTLHLAMQHPLDTALAAEASRICSAEIVCHVAPEVVIQDFLSLAYHLPETSSELLLLDPPTVAANRNDDARETEGAAASWLEEAGRQLAESITREQVVEVAMTTLRHAYGRVAAFAIRNDEAILWRSSGFGELAEERDERVPLGSATLLSRALASEERVTAGRDGDSESRALYRVLGAVEGTSPVVFTVRLRERPVLAVLADTPVENTADATPESLAPLTGLMSLALEAVILRGKILRLSARRPAR